MSKSRTNFGMFKSIIKKTKKMLAKDGNQDGNAVITVPVDFLKRQTKYHNVITDAGLAIAHAELDLTQPMISPAGHPIAGYFTLELYKPTTQTVH